MYKHTNLQHLGNYFVIKTSFVRSIYRLYIAIIAEIPSDVNSPTINLTFGNNFFGFRNLITETNLEVFEQNQLQQRKSIHSKY